jgi:NAD(P)-dependent dehydrogenase (short-subunit alcohol dehydrogenase family)
MEWSERMKLEGKVGLITAGGTGIGSAVARRFVAEGAKVCISSRRQSVLDKVAESLPQGTVLTCAGDVTKAEDAQRMVDSTVAWGGKIDFAINCAAIDSNGAVAEVDPELFRKVLDVNVIGPFLVMKAAIPHMIEAGGGSIVNFSSLGGVRCLPGMAPYCTSKAAVNMLTQQAALDYGPHKIRCNVVSPGATLTESFGDAVSPLMKALNTDLEGVVSRIMASVPLRRAATPEEMTGVCVYLASDDSTFMTGCILMMDGGASVVDVSGAALSNVGINWGVAD